MFSKTNNQDSMVNARWVTRRCTNCRQYRARLVALMGIQEAVEICVETNPSPEWEDSTWPYEITFDGGARTFDDTAVAGAGAILWEHDLQGTCPRQVATTLVATERVVVALWHTIVVATERLVMARWPRFRWPQSAW